MNRSLFNVIAGGFGTEQGVVQTAEGLVHKEIDVKGTVQALKDVNKVVIVPGYGLVFFFFLFLNSFLLLNENNNNFENENNNKQIIDCSKCLKDEDHCDEPEESICYCLNCCFYLCEMHQSYHLKAKSTKEHKIINLNELNQIENKNIIRNNLQIQNNNNNRI